MRSGDSAAARCWPLVRGAKEQNTDNTKPEDLHPHSLVGSATKREGCAIGCPPTRMHSAPSWMTRLHSNDAEATSAPGLAPVATGKGATHACRGHSHPATASSPSVPNTYDEAVFKRRSHGSVSAYLESTVHRINVHQFDHGDFEKVPRHQMTTRMTATLEYKL